MGSNFRSLPPRQNPTNAGPVFDAIVESAEDDGRLRLGNFSSSAGTKKLVHLSAPRSDSDLKLDHLEPETLSYLELSSIKRIHGKAEGRARWEMVVAIRPGCPSGVLPGDTAIVLRASGNPPRLIRIPVLGNAVQ